MGAPVASFTRSSPPTWSMWAWVTTMYFVVKLCRRSTARTCSASSPGSMTTSSRVSASPTMEQLHCSQPTGRISWMSFGDWVTNDTGRSRDLPRGHRPKGCRGRTRGSARRASPSPARGGPLWRGGGGGPGGPRRGPRQRARPARHPIEEQRQRTGQRFAQKPPPLRRLRFALILHRSHSSTRTALPPASGDDRIRALVRGHKPPVRKSFMGKPVRRLLPILLLLVLLAPCAAPAQQQVNPDQLRPPFNDPRAARHWTRDRAYDLQHVKLVLGIDWEEREIAGTATLTLAAAELTIEAVTASGGGKLDFAAGAKELTVVLDRAYSAGEAVTLAIRYRARPRKGFYFVAPDQAYPTKPRQAWTQGESE